MESIHEGIPKNLTVKKSGNHLEIKSDETKKNQVVVNVYLFKKEYIEKFNEIEVEDYSKPNSFMRMVQGFLSTSK